MARYRTVKPEFWTSEQVMDCSPIARLMFIGMWNYADDHGRLPLSPKSIKAQVFPSDDISVDNIRRMIDELSSNGLVKPYVVDDKEYLLITGWHHQKIDKPQKPKYPDPPADNSENARRMVAPEGKGKEEKVVETEANASGAVAPLDPAIPEREYFLRGREVLGKGAGGLIGKLLKAKGGNVALARAAIEQASQKQNPTEYIGAICRGPPPAKPLTEFQQRRRETQDILNDLEHFATTGGRSSEEDPRLLPGNSSQRSEGIHGRLSADVVDLPAGSYRSSG